MPHPSTIGARGASRRGLLRAGALGAGGLGAAGLLAACGDGSSGSSGSGAKVSFQLDWSKNSQFAGFFLADSKKWYGTEGVKPDFLQGADVSSTEAVIAGGAAQLGISSFLSRLVDAVNQGTPLVLVAALYQRSPAGLMSLPGKPVKTPQDIIGKKIGLQEGSKNDIDTVLKVAGLPLNYEAVPVGYDAEPLFAKQVDAYYCYVTSQPIAYHLKGTPYEVVTMEQLGVPTYAGLICTTRDYLRANRPTVVGFLRATIKGWEQTVADPQAAVTLTVDDYGQDLALDRATEKAILEAQLPMMRSDYTTQHGLLRFDPAAITGAMYTVLKASGRTSLPALDTFVDATVLDEVYQGKTSLL
jgi:ABC-type nitrate/sulfonate/bicarbonate transport system substrate-binding protein